VIRFYTLLLIASAAPAAASDPANYLFLGGDDLARQQSQLERPHIGGAHRVYTWRSLERKKDQ
jgi:hypothetical protein